ncbi:MAG: amino acid ABC transporter substrate-binding protein [Caldilineaceae bacterium]|nr:amino acid ABC transporter substrate-binding protein [Caldilineaceae bacterium]
MKSVFSWRRNWLLGALIAAALIILIAVLWQRDVINFAGADRTWLAIQERGTWRVGMDPSFPPFELLDDDGAPVGFDVDLAHALAAELSVDVEIVTLGFDGLIDAVQVGRIDSVISALPLDPRLTQDVRYTTPYFEAGTRLVVPVGSQITEIADLADQRVAVEWGSMGDADVRQIQRETVPSLQRLPFSTPDEALAALLAGDADALVIDGVTLRLAQGRGAAIQAIGAPLEGDPYVIALPFQAHRLHTVLEEALTTLRQDGTLARLEEKWFAAAGEVPAQPSP